MNTSLRLPLAILATLASSSVEGAAAGKREAYRLPTNQTAKPIMATTPGPEAQCAKLRRVFESDDVSAFQALLEAEKLPLDTVLDGCSQYSSQNLLAAAIHDLANKIAGWILNETPQLARDSNSEFNPMMTAAFVGNASIIPALLEAGASATQKNRLGTTPLIRAAEYSCGADRGTRPAEEKAAAASRYAETVRLLLEAGADPNARAEDRSQPATPLILAAECGSVGVVRVLLQAGAKTDAQGKDGKTAFDLALAGRHTNVVDALVAADPTLKTRLDAKTVANGPGQGVRPADVDLALAEALMDRRQDDARQLLEEELADANYVYKGRPLVKWAVLVNDVQTLQLLLSHGAEPDRISASKDFGLGPRGDTEWRLSALGLAAATGNAEAARLLLGAGAEADFVPENVKSEYWPTPLLLSTCEAGSYQGAIEAMKYIAPGDFAGVVSALVEAGASVNRGNEAIRGGYTVTPLMCAAARRDYTSVKALLDAGADPNAKDDKGRTVADSKDPGIQAVLRGEPPPKAPPKQGAGAPATGLPSDGKKKPEPPAAGPTAPPKVANVQMEERDQAVHVTYDVTSGGPAQVALVGSMDGGKTHTVKVTAVSGDVGAEVKPGVGKKIVWQVRQDHPAGLDDKDVTLEARVAAATGP